MSTVDAHSSVWRSYSATVIVVLLAAVTLYEGHRFGILRRRAVYAEEHMSLAMRATDSGFFVWSVGNNEAVDANESVWYADSYYDVLDDKSAKSFDRRLLYLLSKVHPSDVGTLRKMLLEAVSASAAGTYDLEIRLKRGDGVFGWFAIRAATIHDGDRVTKLAGTITSITSEKLERIRTGRLLDTAAVALVVADARGRIVVFNRTAELTFGYTSSEVIGKSVSLLVPEELRENHDIAVAAATMRIAGMPDDMYVFCRGAVGEGVHKSGRLFPANITVSAIKLADKVEYVAVIVPTKSMAAKLERQGQNAKR